jgi:hypothetical protein
VAGVTGREPRPGLGPGSGSGSGSGPVEQYLGELRHRLRVRDADLILAEAEDHLREDVAAGRAAGLTERDAQLAAISSFGSVRSVLRAHQPRWRRVAAGLARPALAAPKVVGLFLVTVTVPGQVGLVTVLLRHTFVPPDRVLVSHLLPGLVGLALLYGSRVARRRAQRGAPIRVAPPARFAAGAVLLFGVASLVLVGFGVAGTIPLIAPTTVACLALAAGYAVRLGTLRRQRRLS